MPSEWRRVLILNIKISWPHAHLMAVLGSGVGEAVIKLGELTGAFARADLPELDVEHVHQFDAVLVVEGVGVRPAVKHVFYDARVRQNWLENHAYLKMIESSRLNSQRKSARIIF